MSSIFRRGGDTQPPATRVAGENAGPLPSSADVGRANEHLRREMEALSQNFGVVDAIRSGLDQFRGALDRALADLERASNALKRTESDLATERERSRALDDELGTLRRLHEGLLAERDTLSLRLADENRRIADLDATLVGLEAELQTKSQYATYLERRSDDLTEQHRAIEAEAAELRRSLTDTDQRLTATEAALAEATQRTAVLDSERQSLDQALSAALSQQQSAHRAVVARDGEITELKAEIGRLRSDLQRAEAEHHKIAINLDEVNVRGAAEAADLRVRLEAVMARANLAERLLAEQRLKMRESAEQMRLVERALADANQRAGSFEQRVTRAEEARTKAEEQLRLGNASRDAAIERASAAAKVLRAKEEVVASSEIQVADATARVAALEETLRKTGAASQARIAELVAELERERSERAMIEGALETARRDRVQLQRELIIERTARNEAEPVRNTRLPTEIANDPAKPGVTAAG